jgi:hypothetical protein
MFSRAVRERAGPDQREEREREVRWWEWEREEGRDVY